MTTPYFAEHDIALHAGHALDVLPSLPTASVHCVLTSPPYYGLRDYGVPGQIGLEESPAEYVQVLRSVLAEVRRVLRADGVLWLNLGDSYSGSWGNQGHEPDRDDLHVRVRGRGALPRSMRTGSRKPGEPGAEESLSACPGEWPSGCKPTGGRFTTRSSGPSPTPCPSRCAIASRAATSTCSCSARARSTGSTWTRSRCPAPGRHQVTRQPQSLPMPPAPAPRTAPAAGAATPPRPCSTSTPRETPAMYGISPPALTPAHTSLPSARLARRCVHAGCPMGGTVLDPFCGSGTALMAARQLGRRGVGIDLNPAYLDLAIRRIGDPPLPFPGDVA